MEPIIEFKKTNCASLDPVEVKYVKVRDKWFELWDETLYKKAFNRPLFKCITREDGLEVLKELHEGACASHIGGGESVKDWALLAHLKGGCSYLCQEM